MSSQDQQQFQVINELCSLVLSILRSPPLSVSIAEAGEHLQLGNLSPRWWRQQQKPSAAAIAALLLGVSLALMLCGSVTFMIGFFIMPWVIGIVMVLFVVGIVMNLSELGRSILFPPPDPVLTEGSTPKDMRRQYLSKLPYI